MSDLKKAGSDIEVFAKGLGTIATIVGIIGWLLKNVK